MLSENNTKELKNFIMIEKILKKEKNNIKTFDLRNINKILIDTKMIKAGLDIGNSKISCIVADYKNSENIKNFIIN